MDVSEEHVSHIMLYEFMKGNSVAEIEQYLRDDMLHI